MKTKIKILFLSLFVMIFVACHNDDDDGYVVNNYYTDIATVQNPDSLASFFFRLDNDILMWTVASNYHNYRPKNGQRIIANYSLLFDKRATGMYDYDVKLNNVYTVLTKGIFQITPATQDSIGSDSITISDIWIGSDYLNVEFVYPGYNKTHYINLVSDNLKVYTDGKTHLEFRHNANGDAPTYWRKGIVSFNLKSLQTSAVVDKTISLVIHVNVPDQVAEKTYSLSYKYGDTPGMIKTRKINFPFDNQSVVD